MTDAQMLEQLGKTAFVPATPEDLTSVRLDELELMPVDQVADLSADAGDFEPHART